MNRVCHNNRANTFNLHGNPLKPVWDELDVDSAYIRRQWIESAVFLPKNWSVYQQAIRTNNDIEGWHNALNRRASGQCGLPLYSMIELLDREARLTAVTIRLVSDKKLKRVQRKQYRNLQARLFNCWEKFERKEKTAAQLLKACSHLNGPARGN